MNTDNLPQHVAIIMDGNGRWAKQHLKPRIFGHRSGVKSVRNAVEFCVEKQITALTLFAFSTENWVRPKEEVGFLMELFIKTINNEIKSLHKNQVRLTIIGAVEQLSQKLQQAIKKVQIETENNQGLRLNIAVNYGGRADIVQAIQKIVADDKQHNISEKMLTDYLSLSDITPPDLLIRTGGEQRISNFLLWQLAYTELYFTDIFWPDFDKNAMGQAIQFFQKRERRFGKISEQLK